MEKRNRIIILIIIIATLIGLVFFLNKDNNISREKMSNIINKCTTYENVSCEYTVEGDKYIYKRLNNIVTLETNSKYIWTDFDKKENYLIQKEDKTVYLQKDEETNIMENKEYHNYMNIINSDDYEYNYMGKEKYNEKKCYLINLINNIDGYNMNIKLWIDCKTGLILKENKEISIDGSISNEEVEYTVILGNVSSEEVEKPNIDKDYNDYEIVEFK